MAGNQKALTIADILRWADYHHIRFGEWPISRSGKILDQPDRTWESVQTALSKGTCGLPGGDSLARLLRRKRKIKDARMTMPDLTLKNVLEWADAHHARTGKWPLHNSGVVPECRAITWGTINRRLRQGRLGQPKGTTLSKWLRGARGSWDGGKPMLTRQLVIRWAEQHYAKFGRWPITTSGPVLMHPDENWAAIDVALRNARRGVREPTSLSRILKEEFGERYTRNIGKRPVSSQRRVTRISVRR